MAIERSPLSLAVDHAEGALCAFLAGKPDLTEPSTREAYLPLKESFDSALEELGRVSRKRE